MKNIFEEAYQKELQAIAAFDAAKNDEEKEKARKLHYEAIAKINNFGKSAIHIWREYQSSREHGNLNLNLSEVIWDEQVPEIVACMKANGIERFTFSATYTEAIRTAWLFQQEGYVLEGFVEINSSNMDAVKTVFQKWSFHREKSGMDNTVGNETDKILFDNFDTLGLFGIITFIDAFPASVAIGYKLSADTCDISTFKHTDVVKDLCRITLREFVLMFGNRFEFFNFEEDGGIEGLRTMKHRLNPCKINELWKATVRRE